MISQTSEELVTTAQASAAKTSNQSTKSQRLNSRTFNFPWLRDSRRESALKKEESQKRKEDLIEVKIVESKARNAIASKTSFKFFKNIKKHIQIKKLSRKSKQRTKEAEDCSLQNDTNCDPLTLQNNRPTISTDENNVSELKCEDAAKNSDVQSSNETLTAPEGLEVINGENVDELETDTNPENIPNIHQLCRNEDIDGTQQSELDTTVESNVSEQEIENIEESTEANTSSSNKVRASLTEELLKLCNYGWYWGPISGNEADAKLISEPDGAFLVRDSSDDRYVLTLSFKSSGKLLHARMEHSGGLFSLCNQSESAGFSSVADLINHSMNFSQSAVYCYSRPKYPGYPSFPVRLTKPVSRFTQVRSLQYLCRFVIRQNTRFDNIRKLPLPKTIKGYIEEAHY